MISETFFLLAQILGGLAFSIIMLYLGEFIIGPAEYDPHRPKWVNERRERANERAAFDVRLAMRFIVVATIVCTSLIVIAN